MKCYLAVMALVLGFAEPVAAQHVFTFDEYPSHGDFTWLGGWIMTVDGDPALASPGDQFPSYMSSPTQYSSVPDVFSLYSLDLRSYQGTDKEAILFGYRAGEVDERVGYGAYGNYGSPSYFVGVMTQPDAWTHVSLGWEGLVRVGFLGTYSAQNVAPPGNPPLYDSTILIDNVAVSSLSLAPEPPSGVLLLTGAIALGILIRRRLAVL